MLPAPCGCPHVANVNLLVDREAGRPDTVTKRDSGGFDRPDEVFDGELPPRLVAIYEVFWYVT